MRRPPAGVEAAPRSPRRWRHGFTPAIAILSVLLAWVPGLGLLFALAGLFMGIWGWRHRVRPRSSGWAIAFASLGLLLSLFFTGLTVFFLPDGADDEEVETWRRFDDLFDPPAAPAAPQGPPGAVPRPIPAGRKRRNWALPLGNIAPRP